MRQEWLSFDWLSVTHCLIFFNPLILGYLLLILGNKMFRDIVDIVARVLNPDEEETL